MLLADAQTGIDWERVLLGYGPLGIFTAVCLYFAIVYGRKIAEGHISLVETLKASANKHDDALETLTQTQMQRNASDTAAVKGLTDTQTAIVRTQEQIVQTQRDIQREVTEQRKLTEKVNEKIGSKTNDPGLMMAMRANTIEIHDHSVLDALKPEGMPDAEWQDKKNRVLEAQRIRDANRGKQ